MVTQFKDNPYERLFYALNQKEKVAEYKRIYLVSELDSKLSEVVNQRRYWHDQNHLPTVKALDLLRTEITYELENLGGTEKFPEVELLRTGKFDSVVHKKTKEFLSQLRRYYAFQSGNAKQEREALESQLNDTPEKKERLEQMRLQFKNKAVTRMVESSDEEKRIVEWKGRLVQKFYPIYFEDHHPRNIFDFQATFFVPTKQFMGRIYDTFYFNLSVIWTMTVVLYLTLYFDLLKRLVHGLEMRRKYRKKKQ